MDELIWQSHELQKRRFFPAPSSAGIFSRFLQIPTFISNVDVIMASIKQWIAWKLKIKNEKKITYTDAAVIAVVVG